MPPDAPDSSSSTPEDEDSAPLVMERFRRSGVLVAVVLAPLLVVTLAQTALSLRVVLGALVVGVVVVLALAARR